VYLDSAYIAKYYVNEPDSQRVRALVQAAESRVTSGIAVAEIACVMHRHMREGALSAAQVGELLVAFFAHIESGHWTILPVTQPLLRRANYLVSTAPPNAFLRAGDAIHLTSASEIGEAEIWASDRHMLAAASHFGLVGRSA
jgi:predicted nucleic acid-binding protein